MKLSNKQRTEIVELLRCAADIAVQGQRVWLEDVATIIGTSARTTKLAQAALVAIQSDDESERERDTIPPDFDPQICLEAAQRVEDDEWP